jgi:hypothetical protein
MVTVCVAEGYRVFGIILSALEIQKIFESSPDILFIMSNQQPIGSKFKEILISLYAITLEEWIYAKIKAECRGCKMNSLSQVDHTHLQNFVEVFESTTLFNEAIASEELVIKFGIHFNKIVKLLNVEEGQTKEAKNFIFPMLRKEESEIRNAVIDCHDKDNAIESVLRRLIK